MANSWLWNGSLFQISLEEAAFNTDDRTATLGCTVYRKSNNTLTGRYRIDIAISGDRTHGSYIIIPTNNQAIVDQFSFTVSYPDDVPNKTLTITPSILYTNGSLLESYSAQTCTLTPMPLSIPAPTLSASSANFGASITITTKDPDSASLKYDISYTFGTASGNIGTNLTAGAKSWTVANSLMNQIPSATKGVISISVNAKNSAGNVLQSWTLSLTANVPSSIVPTVTTAVSEAATIPSGITGYVKSKSKLSVTHTAAGTYSSTITSITTTLDGATYDGASFTSNIINSSGTVAVKVTVKDSRGRTASRTTNVTVQDYSAPKITSVSAYRCTSASSTTAKADGGYICVKPLGSITALGNKNAKTCKVYYKKSSATSYSNAAITMSDYVLDTEYYIFTADINSSFDIYVELTDSFSATRYVCQQVSSGGAYIHIPPGRGGIGFGKRVENENALETAWKISSNDDVEADADGKKVGLLDASKRVRNYYDARPSTLDVPHESDGSMITFKATSSATASGTKPPVAGDSHIMHFFWDNTGKYDSQIAVPDLGSKSVEWRGMNGSAWQAWRTILDSANFKTFFTTAVMEELLGMSSADITIATISGLTITKDVAKVIKSGKLVELEFHISWKSSGSSTYSLAANTTIATIPSGYRPAVKLYGELETPSGGIWRATINTDGTIKSVTAFSISTSQHERHMRLFYICA